MRQYRFPIMNSPSEPQRSDQSYWLALFRPKTWLQSAERGFTVVGFRSTFQRTARQIQSGDVFLCYVGGASRFVGALEIVKGPYFDESPIWDSDIFPCRFRVKPLVALPVEQGVRIKHLSNQLSFFRDMATPTSWAGHVGRSLMRIRPDDAVVILQAIRASQDRAPSRDSCS